jgi:hypothetical protein
MEKGKFSQENHLRGLLTWVLVGKGLHYTQSGIFELSSIRLDVVAWKSHPTQRELACIGSNRFTRAELWGGGLKRNKWEGTGIHKDF